MYRVGEIVPTLLSGNIEILEYINQYKIKVRFMDTGFEDFFLTTSIKSGKVKDKLRRSVRGFGYFGIGPYKGPREEVAYTYWLNMIRRCYDEMGNPSYHNVSICEEWANYQTFAKWCYDQPNFPSKGWHLDKDWFSIESYEYSPQTCVFVPPDINYFLVGVKTRVVKKSQKTNARYLQQKKEKARMLAEKYEGVIPSKLYEMLINYTPKGN